MTPLAVFRWTFGRGRGRRGWYRALNRLRALVLRAGPPQDPVAREVTAGETEFILLFLRTKRTSNPHCR